ncbi:Ger(x)C family spore germination protein [Bacillus sp. EB01]|uniref:Ger(x)C family spore germination protein n=1 Tax=Bacillus sp. EB01 TaxID=1347086 RepID=UPI0005C5FCF3|nr:Ger(x)C family spore germination protein [Bacillus sp. EB01]
MSRLKLLYSIICTVVLTGCWDRTEINDMAFVIATGVDKGEKDNYSVSAQIPLPSAMGGAGSSGGGGGTTGGPYFVIMGKGRSIKESYDDMQIRMSRELYLAHRRVIVIGEDMAREGIRQPIETILLQPQSRLSTFLVISKGKAFDMLSTQPKMEKLPGEAIREMAKSNLGMTIKDVILDIERPGKVAVVPVISTADEKGSAKEGKEIIMQDYAVFWRDRMKFITNKKESLGILWLFEKMDTKAITFPVQPGRHMSLQIIESRFRPIYALKKGKPSFTIRIEAASILMDNDSNIELDDAKTYGHIKKMLEKEIKGQVEAILNRAHKEKADVAGLGWYLYKSHHSRWDSEWKENWYEKLPELDFTVQVDCDIQRMSNSGLQVKE